MYLYLDALTGWSTTLNDRALSSKTSPYTFYKEAFLYHNMRANNLQVRDSRSSLQCHCCPWLTTTMLTALWSPPVATSDKTPIDSNTPPHANEAILATMHVDTKQKRRNCVCKWGNICEEFQLTLHQYCTDRKVNHVAFGLVRISVKNAPSNICLIQPVGFKTSG
jgi:hypothetical protein